ncbi:hypothetical protein AB0C52_00320 [Streptomyces sp. NPDC048717]|uniref:hypothetical protein n=1 Tax=unclassified Streptomyces TaxID=2593676 RepID=UPI00342F363F
MTAAPLRKLTGDQGCRKGSCPTLWTKTATGDYVVQGYVITDPAELAMLDLPTGETAVRVPAAMLEEYFGGRA